MGHAKKRGTFQERKASAIHDTALAAKMLKEQEDKFWASLTDDERENIYISRKRAMRAHAKQLFLKQTLVYNNL